MRHSRKTIYGELRRHLGGVLGKLAEQKEIRIERSQIQVDHVHTKEMRERIKKPQDENKRLWQMLREADEPPSGGPQDPGPR